MDIEMAFPVPGFIENYRKSGVLSRQLVDHARSGFHGWGEELAPEERKGVLAAIDYLQNRVEREDVVGAILDLLRSWSSVPVTSASRPIGNDFVVYVETGAFFFTVYVRAPKGGGSPTLRSVVQIMVPRTDRPSLFISGVDGTKDQVHMAIERLVACPQSLTSDS